MIERLVSIRLLKLVMYTLQVSNDENPLNVISKSPPRTE